MIKFAGLVGDVDNIIDSLDMEQMTGKIPSKDDPDRNSEIIKVIESVSGSNEVAKCWANATQMRRWLTQKKQSLGQKFKELENDSKTEDSELKTICSKIVKKAEFLVALQPPSGVFKSTEPSAPITRKPSYIPNQEV